MYGSLRRPQHTATAGRIMALCALSLFALMLIAPASAFGDDIIYVSVASGSDGTGNGTEARPYRSIDKGLSEASSGDCVRIMPGQYSAATTGETFPLWVPRGVRVQGTVSWDHARVTGDGTHSVFRIDDGDENTVIEGLRISGGGGSTGGAIHITGGTSPGWGPKIQRNDIADNHVTGNGGAIAVYRDGASSCSPAIRNNLFRNNSAENGGAIYEYEAVLDVWGCNFVTNQASEAGGALDAVLCASGVIEGCQISGSQAVYGTARFVSCGSIDIRRSVFSSADVLYGGGVYNNNATALTVENTVFQRNEAISGGAVYNVTGSTAFNFCTIIENDATSTGDGIQRSGGTVTVRSSILWDNNGDDIAGGALLTACDTQEPTLTGPGVIHSDPKFKDPGSPYPLLSPTSPCIDTGDYPVTSDHDFDLVARPQDGDGNGSKRADMGAFEYWLDVQRDAGSTRYSTATEAWDDRTPMSHHAIIATGLNFPDALCASGLSGLYNAPILLTKPNELPYAVRVALQEHETYEAFVVGGPDVVSDDVVAQLEAMNIDVTRLYGADRYATAHAVARHIQSMRPMFVCVIARGDLFPDALALSPIAATRSYPVLLVKPDSLPNHTRAALEETDYARAILGGDTTAVSTQVEDAVDAYIGVGGIVRLGGATRYETAAEIAEWTVDEHILRPRFFGIATGQNFPDALAGGVACGFEGGPLLLTKQDSLRWSASQVMLDSQDELREIYLFGGSDVVSDQVMDDCAQLMP